MIAAIVLAAGQSARFGQEGVNKLLEEFGGAPLIRRAVDAALRSRAGKTIVVTGWDHARIAATIADRPVTLAHNPRCLDGMASSLQTGLAAAHDADGVLVLLGDMPNVDAMILDRLIEAFETTEAQAIIPAHEGRRGNPVLLGRAIFPRLAALRGDTGARDLLRGLDKVVELEIAQDAILTDVDTARDLDLLREGLTRNRYSRV
jgi:molybdenum cofactor cytidylyltransferase